GVSITFNGVMNAISFQLLSIFGVITLIFSVLNRNMPTTFWEVGWKDQPMKRPAKKTPQVPRLESVVQIIATVVFLVWLRLLFDQPSLSFGSLADTYRLGEVWHQVALPTVLILLVSIAQAIVNLFRPDWVRFQLIVRLATDLGVLGIVLFLTRS